MQQNVNKTANIGEQFNLKKKSTYLLQIIRLILSICERHIVPLLLQFAKFSKFYLFMILKPLLYQSIESSRNQQ